MAMQRRERPLSAEEYLAQERQAESKREFWDGAVYALAGASSAHNIVVANVISSLGAQLRQGKCTVYASDMRLRVVEKTLYTYPDVTVVCGKPQFEDRRQDSLLNPTVIVEVLSPSTERYDRGAKFQYTRALASLNDYLLIAQDRPSIEHYVRQAEDKWLLTSYTDLKDVAPIESITCDLVLADVYAKVEWPDDAGSSRLRLIEEEEYSYSEEPE